MHLLLLSWNLGALDGFLTRHTGRPAAETRIAYVDDAMSLWADQPWANTEFDRLAALPYRLTRISAGTCTAEEFDAVLAGVDAVYVCGGHTFALLKALRETGTAEVLSARVRAGLPYVGLSAGAVLPGPSIEPVSLMDDPSEVPGLTDFTGLGLVDTVVIPHAGGEIPLFPPELIDRIVHVYGSGFPLTLVDDHQALLVDDDGAAVIPSPAL